LAIIALVIAGVGALTGTLSLGLQFWNARYRFREALALRGNVDTTTNTLTFMVRNRDPQTPAVIEKVYQYRRRNWLSLMWHEFPASQLTHNGEVARMPVEIGPRTEETFTISDDYFARAIRRARDSNADAVLFYIRAGSGYTFRLRPDINGKRQP
jgi:hypothetical protein